MAFEKKKFDLRSLILCTILSVLVVVMSVIPYTGYINYGLIEITTLHIITILAGVLLGAGYGSVVGAVWGLSCIVRCITVMPMYQPFGFANVFVAFIPRVLVGTVSGALFSALRKTRLTRTFSIMISAVAGALTNTVLVLSAMSVYCRMHGVEGYESAGVYSVLSSIVTTLAGINGILELVAAVVIVPAAYKALAPKRTVLGIDFGTSTTKLALVQNGRCIKAIRKADDESLEEAITRLGVSTVSAVAVTGVGASESGEILGKKPFYVDEFRALSRGAAKISRKYNCVVASIGTGTSFVRITPVSCRHIGGSGLGGGTLKGLGERVLGVTDMDAFRLLATEGDLGKVDLELKDITEREVPDLLPTTTVANLAKLDPSDSDADIAAGITNMIFESIGVMASLIAKSTLTRTVVLTGTITDWTVARRSLDEVSGLHHVTFIVPDRAAYAGAIGAALSE